MTVPPRRILVVEDHDVNRQLVRILLQSQGYAVSEADSLAAARTVLGDAAADLVLLDMELPDGHGSQLLAWIRANGAMASVRVVALTAQAMAGDKERFRTMGFDGYISKPFSRQAFLAAIATYVPIP